MEEGTFGEESLTDLLIRKEKELQNIAKLRLQQLQEQLYYKDQTITQLQNQIQKLHEDFNYNLKLIQERDEELSELEQTVNDLNMQLRTKEDELALMRNSQSFQLQSPHFKNDVMIEDLKLQLAELKRTKDETISIKDEEIKMLKQKYQRDIENSKEVINQTSFYNVNYEALVNDYKKRNEELERELQDSRSRINAMRYEYESLQNRYKDLEESLKDRAMDSNEEYKKLKEGLKMRAEQLQTLEYKLGTEQTRYELLLHENAQTITSLKIENDSLQGRVRETEAKLSAQAKESRYELDALQTKCNALEARVSAKTYDYSDEITKLKETMKLKNEQIATLEMKNSTEQKLFEQIMKDNQARINSLVAEREELTRELEERKMLFNNELKLANQMSDASIEQMQNSLRSQISAYQQQVAELKAELENKENVIYRIKRQNKELEMYKEIPTTLPKMDYSETRKNSFYDKRASPTTFDDMRTHTHKEASPYERNVRRPSVNSSGWRCKIQQVKSTLDDHFMNFSRYD